jgi:hypothetical protein
VAVVVILLSSGLQWNAPNMQGPPLRNAIELSGGH